MAAHLFVSEAAAPPGCARLLVTVIGAPVAPAVRPELVSDGGQKPAVSTLRPWTSLRGATPAGGVITPGWSTLIEFPVPSQSRRFPVTLTLPGLPAVSLVTKPMPTSLGTGDDTFNVLLVSCYHADEDTNRLVSGEADRIDGEYGIDLTLMMGDQVYLDLPTLDNLPKEGVLLADALERKYRNNFVPAAGNFASLLQYAPNVTIPDDHEYWNNAPHSSPIIQNSWTQQGRDTWRAVADRLFCGYQGFSPATGFKDEPFKHFELEIGPLSFFVANARSFRTEDRKRSLDPTTLKALLAWEARLIRERRFGVLVTGQSLLDPEASAFEGKVADFALSNYDDCAEIVAAIDRLAAKSDVLLLTGDVHWGRVTRLCPTSDLHDATSIYEVICSPTSLVTTIVTDSFKRTFNAKDPWPRHPEVPLSPRLTRLKGARTPFWAQTLHRQRGDMLCLLSFSTNGDGVKVAPTYFPIHRATRSQVTPFTLQRR